MRSWGLSATELEQLERRVGQRDRAAFSQLYRAYESVIETFLVEKLHDQRRARALTKRVFTQAWERIDRYPWRDFSFQVWLMRIARDELEEPAAPHPEADGTDESDLP